MLAPKSDVDANAGNDRLASILFLLVWAWTVVPKIIQTVAVPKYRTFVTQEAQPLTPMTSAASLGLLVILLGFCTFVILNAFRSNPRRNPGVLVLMLAPWAVIQTRDWISFHPFRLTNLSYPVPVIAAWLLAPGLRQLRLLGYLVGAVAVISLVLGVMLPGHAIFQNAAGEVITAEKNLLPWGMLIGIYTHGNSLGQFLALGIPMITLIQRTSIRLGLLGITTFALIWSTARSSIISILALIVVVALMAAIPKQMRAVPARLILICVWAVVVIVPLSTRDPTAFTNRGFIWGASLLAWRSHPLFGWGSRYYHELARTSADLGGTVYHGHNELVQLLVVGGLVLAGMVAALLLTAIVKAARWAESTLIGFAFMFVLAGVSLLEISLSFVDNAFVMSVMVLPLATLMFGSPGEPALRGTGDADLQLVGDDAPGRLP